MKILIVEDEEDLCELYQYKLGEAGHKVKVCNNGVQGANCLMNEDFDLIITDINMPFKDGDDLIMFYRKSTLSETPTPIVVVSGFVTPDLEKELRSLKKVFILSKPFKWEALFDIIATKAFA